MLTQMNNKFSLNNGVNKQRGKILRKCSDSEQSWRKIHHQKWNINGTREKILKRDLFNLSFASYVICIN